MSFLTRLRPGNGEPADASDPPVDAPDADAAAGGVVAREAAVPGGSRRRLRATGRVTTTVLAGLLVWFALVGPDQFRRMTPAAFVRVPLEGLVVLALVLLLPARPRRVLVWVAGILLALLTVVKIIDMGFFEVLNRPFNPFTDWGYFGSAEGLLQLAVGHTNAILFMVGAILLGIGVLVFVPLSVRRLARLAHEHRAWSLRGVVAFGVVWALAAALGAQIVAGSPVASTSVAGLAYSQALQVNDGLRDKSIMRAAAANDPYRTLPADSLLTGLRGKDVIVAFVESYGQTAVQGSSFSPQVDAVLTAGSGQLASAGYASRSAFLTSPTFGGISWLAHSTLQSGVWIDNQQRYNDLVTSDRFTLSDAFKKAGWRTVADVPSNEKAWPEGVSFYHYDQIYDEHNVGYHGPRFSYAAMPDQYILSAFQRLELTEPHAPVMAEIDLVSSHTPWAPLPHLVPWDKVGDGSIFKGMPAQGQQPTQVWTDPNKVRAAYGQSVVYTLSSLISFVQTYPDPNLVLLVLGDHQPSVIVSGQNASHEVPVSIIARDPAVMDRIAGWDWQPGLLPGPDAPVWRMDTFRNRFLSAYGPQPQATGQK